MCAGNVSRIWVNRGKTTGRFSSSLNAGTRIVKSLLAGFFTSSRSQSFGADCLGTRNVPFTDARQEFIHLARNPKRVQFVFGTKIFIRAGELREAILDSDATDPAGSVTRRNLGNRGAQAAVNRMFLQGDDRSMIAAYRDYLLDVQRLKRWCAPSTASLPT